MDKRLGIVALVLAVFFFGTLTLAVVCSEPTPPPEVLKELPPPNPAAKVPTSLGVPCELIEVKDTSFPGRKRTRAFIAVPGGVNSLTTDQRAQTALGAAVEISQKTGSTYVLVQMTFDAKAMSAGWAAEAEFSTDGRDQSGETRLRNGHWQAKVSKAAPTEDELRVIRSWDQHADSFRGSDGLLDEKKLRAKIEKETGLSLETITAARDRYGYGGKLVEYDPP